jgi:hypothetical protein
LAGTRTSFVGKEFPVTSQLRRVFLALGLLAAAAAALPVRAEHDPDLAQLIRQLGSDEFAEREAASKALQAVGEAALDALEEATQSADAEVRHRAVGLRCAIGAGARERASALAKELGLKTETQEWRDERVEVVDLREKSLANWQLHQLRGLALGDNPVFLVFDGGGPRTDTSFRLLRGLANLRGLTIRSPRVTDTWMPAIGELRHLWLLDLGNTQVSDATLAHIEGLTELRVLDLEYTMVSDEGLARLKGLKEIRLLNIRRTKVTARGVSALKKTYPHLTIIDDRTF